MLVYVHGAKYISNRANWLPKMRTFSAFFSVVDVANIRFNKLIINLGIKHRRAMIEFGPGICLHSTPGSFHSVYLLCGSPSSIRLDSADWTRCDVANLKCVWSVLPVVWLIWFKISKPYSSATASASAFNSILYTFCVALAVNCCCMRIYAAESVVIPSISQWQSRFVPCIELYSSEHSADACEWRTHTHGNKKIIFMCNFVRLCDGANKSHPLYVVDLRALATRFA